jgi:hypothetical protein
MPENENVQINSPEPTKPCSPFVWPSFITSLISVILYFVATVFIEQRAFFFLSIASFVISVLCAVCAMVQFFFHKGRYRGMSLVSLPLVVFFLVLAFVPFSFSVRPVDYKLACASNLSGLGKAIIAYSNDYNNRMPTPEKWCDILITYADVSPSQLVCRESDTRKGESSYAMNKFVADANISSLDPNIVLLFETEAGKVAKPSSWSSASKPADDYKLDESDAIHPKFIRGPSLDKNRWNQCGGPEILTASHHEGEGANILFADYHVDFVLVKDFPKLRWKP